MKLFRGLAFVLIILIYGSPPVKAQVTSFIAGTKNNIGLPGNNILSPDWNLGLEIGLLFKIKSTKRAHFGFSLGGFQKSYDSAIYVFGDVSHLFGIKKFSISLDYGLGYMHNYINHPVFRLENGEYEETYHRGSSSVALRLGSKVEYSITQDLKVGTRLFQIIQLPYSRFANGITRSSFQVLISKTLNNPK